jgi:hypothetical protein
MPLLNEVGKCCSSYCNLMQYGSQTNAEKLCECPITRNKCVSRWSQTSNNSSPVRLSPQLINMSHKQGGRICFVVTFRWVCSVLRPAPY